MIIAIIIGALIFIGGYFYVTSKSGNNRSNDAKAVEPNTVIIKNFRYGPDTLEVSVGTTVTWINEDFIGHDVKSAEFSSPKLKQGEKFTFTYTKAGEFDYICSIHPAMVGKVIVK